MEKEVLSHYCRRTPPELPDLNELFDASRTADSTSIQDLLRQTALKSRRDHLQPFYSIRAVAEHFHVAPARVSRIYQRLAAQQILRTVWGSKTLLEPLKSSQDSECRSIGIAIDLGRFVKFPDYRVSILSLQLEVWNHELNGHLLFFETDPEELVNLCTRNHHPHMHTIVWLFPQALHSQVLLRLRDLGFRVLCLSEQATPGIPDCNRISQRSTIRALIRKKVLKI